MTEQDRRRGQNEALFRALNEHIEDLGLDNGTKYVDFICECSSTKCLEVIHATREEYERVRASSREFLVAVGHEAPDIEEIVERCGRFNVVEKHGEAAAVAELSDPRS